MASSFSPSRGTSRNTRVCRLLVDLCPCLLRDILRHDIPERQFKSKLKRKEGILKNKLLNKDQCALLFPAPGQYYNNDYSEFDSALLYILIRTLCSYNAHKRGWGSVPRTQDVSVSACVERIRIARNKYVGHMSRFDMDGPTFLSIWAEIKQVVVELEKVLSPTKKSVLPSTSYEIEMDKLETDPLDPEMEQFYKEKIEQQEKAFHEDQENANHVRRNILANTSSRISNHSTNCYVSTKAVQAIIDQLKSKNIVIVAGGPGSGKTTTVLEVLKKLVKESNESYTPAILDNPEYWDQVVNSSERLVIFLDNPMGKSNFDRLNFVKWEQKFENMISCSTNGNCCIIIAIRDIVLQEMIEACRPNSLFTQQNTINISIGDSALDNVEKIQIITQYQITNKRELCDKDKSLISKSQPYYGFPQTCFLFFTNKSLFELGVSFFSRPDKTLVNEIEKLRKSDKRNEKLQYYILVYVLIYRTLNMLCIADNVVTKIGNLANLREIKALEIKDSIEELNDIYVVYKQNANQELMFRHQTIKEAVLISYFNVNPKLVIKSCSLADLGELIRTDTHLTKDQEVVLIIAKSEYQDIVDKFISLDPSCVELLECCVFNEWIGILEILFLKDETLLNRADDYGMTLVTYAALWKKKELVNYLYDRKANVKHVNRFGSCLHFCVLNEWTDLLDIIFADDPTLIDQINANDVSLIEYAAKKNKTDIVMYLYKMNANIMNKFQIYKFLKYCVDNKWHDVLAVILKKDQTLIDVKVTQTHSLITYAASQNNLDIVKQLLDHIKKETEFSDPFCLLKICVDNEWYDLLDKLFKDWSNLLYKKNKDGISLTCYAAQWDKKDMVEFLMKHGASDNSICFLENCVDNEWTDILESALTKTPTLLNTKMADDDRFTLICYAASEKKIPIVDLLLDHIAAIHNSMFLKVCVDNELTDVSARVITQRPDIVNYKTPNGETLICYAARKMQREIVLVLINQGASIEQEDLTRKSFIQLCVDNNWEDVLDILFKKDTTVVNIYGAFGSTLFASDTSEHMFTFLYAYIPRGSLSHFYIHNLFHNCVIKRRFYALEICMREYPECSSYDNAFCNLEEFYSNVKIPDNDIYKIMCIDQSLVDDKTASPTFQYCLENRPQVVLRYIAKYQNVWNINIDGKPLILHAAIEWNEEIVLCLIFPWTNDIHTSNNDIINLLGHCIDNKWDGVIRKIMRLKQFVKDNALAMMIHAFDKGFYKMTNIIFQNTTETTDNKDSCFLLLKKLVDNGDVRLISILLQHNIKREYIHNSKGESLLTYVALSNKRQLSMFLVEKLVFEDFLGIDIETLLQLYIEKDWDDILQIIPSKTYKLVTNAKLGDIIRYAIRNNTKELILSILEYEIDHKMISVITKHCRKLLLNEDKEIVNVLECDDLPVANYVARYGKEAILEQLYLSNKVNIEYFDKYGYTPLHYCAAKGWTSIVDMMVKTNPGSSVQTQNGVDCVHFAAFFGRYAMLKMFICKGHKLKKKNSVWM